MAETVVACTVRECGLPLNRGERTWTCRAGHVYDLARSGYVNLLQPQDRRSPAAGDSKEAVEARARLLASGVGRTILDAFVKMALGLSLAPGSVVVELGAGAGEGLGQLASQSPIDGVGIDLSTAAASQAARRFPRLTWVVANVDRKVPIVDRSASLVLSLHARRNPAECARILAARHLLVAIPAADDLIELREAVMGDGMLRDRVEGVVAEHASLFDLEGRRTVRERKVLAREALVDLLHGTYRGARTSAVERVRALVPVEVTVASDLLLFSRR